MEAKPWRPHERLLAFPPFASDAQRVLCNTVGRGQFALHWAEQHPTAEVTCFLNDLYRFDQCVDQERGNLNWVCSADPPDAEPPDAEPPDAEPPDPEPTEAAYDLVALAFGHEGEAELTREILQACHQRLAIGGRMVVTTDNPQDQWLGDQLRLIFKRVSREQHEQGARYFATKTEPLKRVRRFDCEFAFRDRDRIIHLRSRPGVFSHRHLDPGARAILRALEVVDGTQVLDLGCGSGAIGIAAGLRAANVRVLALDSNPRAVECTEWGADRNHVPSLVAELDHDGSTITAAPPAAWYGPGTFDLVAVNPPYFSHFRIADQLMRTAEQALAPEGQLLVVTKTAEWYEDRLAEKFREIEFLDARNFLVVRATRRS